MMVSVDQTRRHQKLASLDDAIGARALRRGADGGDARALDEHARAGQAAARLLQGGHEASAADEKPHARPPGRGSGWMGPAGPSAVSRSRLRAAVGQTVTQSP